MPCGLALRGLAAAILPRLIRGQMLVVAMPLAFAAGLVFAPRFPALISMAALVAAEGAGIWVGGVLNRRAGTPAVSLTASSSNTSIWSLPIAGLLFGPSAVTFVAVFDQIAFPRTLLLISRLRSFAPRRQLSRTAFIDYGPASALVCGLVLQALVGRPHSLMPWLPRLGLTSAATSMLLVGAAIPATHPSVIHARRALVGALFRFIPPAGALATLHICGVHPPAAAWILAFAPSYYTMLSFSRLYGYDAGEAIATAITTTMIAMLALPVLVLTLR